MRWNEINKITQIRKGAMERKQNIAVVWKCRKNEATQTVKINNSSCTDWKVLWDEINNTRRNYVKRQGVEFEERTMM